MDFFFDNIRWFVAGGIVLIGLLLLGLKDVLRFSIARVWAISGVCFDESIRRRVLWITPLAIIGVVIVSQFTRPYDAQDAIRQTTKFCLFATGLLVVITTIILACTNLPKEIENRVIFTVVTKPTTRLEIVVGKVLGFARVSAAILLIMGLFTWGYLSLRVWNIQRDVREILATTPDDDPHRPTLIHYASPGGLLSTTSFEHAARMQIFARAPRTDQTVRWMLGNSESELAIHFALSRNDLTIPSGSGPRVTPAILHFRAQAEYAPGTSDEVMTDPVSSGVFELTRKPPIHGPVLSALSSQPEEEQHLRPVSPIMINVRINDDTLQQTVTPAMLANNGTLQLYPTAEGFTGQLLLSPEAVTRIVEWLPPAGRDAVLVHVFPLTPNTLLGIDPDSIRLELPEKNVTFQPGSDLSFQGRSGNFGQQLKGAADGRGPLAIFSFRDADRFVNQEGDVPFELRSGIERSGADLVIDDADFTNVEVSIVDPETREVRHRQLIRPESNRYTYFNVPADALDDGNFDLVMQVHTPGHWLGLRHEANADGKFTGGSLSLVKARQHFLVNLFKSLLILWLMSLLVVIVSIFCSTFLSWPIAIVLTLVILLGHWGVSQIADVATPGIGRRVAQDWFSSSDAAQARVVSETVEALTRLLDVAGKVLPDITQFQATEDIERGVTVPPEKVVQALKVILAFGFPLMVVSYIFLKNKEVAP